MMRLRLVTGLLGLLLAVIAIARDDKRIAWAAIAMLIVAVAVRVVARRRAARAPED